MKFNKTIITISIFALGLILGALFTVGGYYYSNRNTVVYTAKQQLISGNIIIPKGTELIHGGSMAEGFDRLVLHLNVDHTTLKKKLEHKTDPRPFLVIPYWIDTAQ